MTDPLPGYDEAHDAAFAALDDLPSHFGDNSICHAVLDAAYPIIAAAVAAGPDAEIQRLRGQIKKRGEMQDALLARAVDAETERDRFILRAQRAEAAADAMQRTLLDETYRPEGGETVMRELQRTQLDRDEWRNTAYAAKEHYEQSDRRLAAVAAVCDAAPFGYVMVSQIRAALEQMP